MQIVQSVGVAPTTKGDMPVTLSSLGTVTSLATITVQSQISGYLTSVNFHEGQMVKKGDLLAQVDTRAYEVALTQYQGQLERDQALLDNARVDLARYERLIKQDSTTGQTLDTQKATVKQDEGTVLLDQAQVDAQKLNLEYCRIVSPVDGRVGLRQVDAGNYITASSTTGIVVVTQTTPTSVVFTLPQDNLPQVLSRLKAGAHLAVTAYDRTGTVKLAQGTLDALDNEIDTTTGTLRLRAVFENADGSLFPNQFVDVTLLVDTLHDVVLVPNAAVDTGTPGTFVYVLNADNTVSLRKIRTGPSADGNTAVLSGLAEGDKVVVDGGDHLSDGAKVSVPANAPPQDGAAPAARKRPDKAQ
ncbi:MdtA/MuxA family multidrug efflux RND transporter periplasmic adaptor subunit [Rhizobium sp. NPDC090279]|uniref:MdtA/MuxA family multidrug efflux RND transporter periplasmic adaptor subunit n=1 Tax=Rhizobium sp. NPDC090279 TaxID=3364499 RepID=UPI00383AE04E